MAVTHVAIAMPLVISNTSMTRTIKARGSSSAMPRANRWRNGIVRRLVTLGRKLHRLNSPQEFLKGAGIDLELFRGKTGGKVDRDLSLDETDLNLLNLLSRFDVLENLGVGSQHLFHSGKIPSAYHLHGRNPADVDFAFIQDLKGLNPTGLHRLFDFSKIGSQIDGLGETFLGD